VQLVLRGNIASRLKECSAYVDDILIATRAKQSLNDTFQKPKSQSIYFVLIINEQKVNI
jgi:hypothetical protein